MTAPPATELLAPLTPGVYLDVPNDVYHADPVAGGSLSSTGARRIIPPSCPAKFKHERDHGRPPKAAFDFGHVAHRLVLGRGDTIEIIDADTYKTKAAQEARDTARAEGRVPILAKDYAIADEMADALRAHPQAGPLFTAGAGDPEVTLVWDDPDTGVRCRARLDWFPRQRRHRLIIPDYKTCPSASPDDLTSAVARFGYHQQSEFYLDGVRALGLAADPAFVFVFQEKEPPYIVTVAQLDHDTIMSGRLRNQWARQVYRWCTDRDEWPPYCPDITTLALPPWHQEPTGE